MDEPDLTGRRVLITGGASGMGAGLVKAFPRLGARVVSLDIDADAGAAIADEAQAVGFVRVDVSDSASVCDAVERAAGLLGGLDAVVHAAGVAPASPAATTPIDLWSRVLAINATGTYLVNQAAFAHLKDRGGAIVNFASTAGVEGYPGKSAYAAAKGAVVAWTRTIATEWGKHNIRVNAIAPAIWTPMYDKTRSEMTAEQLAAHDRVLAAGIPLGGKLGDIDGDLVPVAAFLISDGAHFLTGQIFPVDGGAMMMR